MNLLAPWVAMRDRPHIQQHVALTDGAEALQQQMITHFPQYTLILDIMHATEYLWDTAKACWGRPIHIGGYTAIFIRCWRGKPTPLLKRCKLRGTIPRTWGCNGRRCGE
jgi:hypothetical protein